MSFVKSGSNSAFDQRRAAFAQKKAMGRSRSNMDKIAEHKRITEMKEKAGLTSRAKSILKPRSTTRKIERGSSVSSSKKVRFEPKKSVVLF